MLAILLIYLYKGTYNSRHTALNLHGKTAGGHIKKWAEVGGRKKRSKTPAHRTYTKIITPSTNKKFGLKKN